jgi:MOSC domain-containing protein YiiM
MTLERMYLRARSGGPTVQKLHLALVAGQGIEGDRYFGCHDEPGQNLTLVEAEVIEDFLRALGRPVDLSVTGRNLVTRGVRLNSLIGRRFRLGSALLRGVDFCHPCRSLGEALAGPGITPTDVVRAFVASGGLRADVLVGGEVRVGDALSPDD